MMRCGTIHFAVTSVMCCETSLHY